MRVEIATKELEYLTNRLNSLVVAASVVAGFAFTALVELHIDGFALTKLDEAGYDWIEDVYYLSMGLTIAFNLYIIVIATVTAIRAQRMALHGHVDNALLESEIPESLGYLPGAMEGAAAPTVPTIQRMESMRVSERDDVQRAIMALRSVQPSILIAWGLSLCTFTAGVVAMIWIKTEPMHFDRTGHPNNLIALYSSGIFIVLLMVLLCANIWVGGLFRFKTFHDGRIRAAALPGELQQPLV